MEEKLAMFSTHYSMYIVYWHYSPYSPHNTPLPSQTALSPPRETHQGLGGQADQCACLKRKKTYIKFPAIDNEQLFQGENANN